MTVKIVAVKTGKVSTREKVPEELGYNQAHYLAALKAIGKAMIKGKEAEFDTLVTTNSEEDGIEMTSSTGELLEAMGYKYRREQ